MGHPEPNPPAATRRPDAPRITSVTLAFCAARWHIVAARYRDLGRVPAALLGRFLPRLGPLAPASGPFFCTAADLRRDGPIPEMRTEQLWYAYSALRDHSAAAR